MSSKTPAELQLEALKKLKEQQLSGKIPPKAPRLAEQGAEPRASRLVRLEGPPKKRKAKGSGGALKIGPEAWARLREEGFKSGRLKQGKALGDWAIELVLNIPPEMAGLSEDAKREIYAKIRDWSAARGLS